MAGIADDAAHLMVISDADGTLLWLEGSPRVRPGGRQLDELRRRRAVERGRRGHERDRHGARRRPRGQVFAAEHFNEVVQDWTCAAAPVHDPETGACSGSSTSPRA
jgi:hypothetical protein